MARLPLVLQRIGFLLGAGKNSIHCRKLVSPILSTSFHTSPLSNAKYSEEKGQGNWLLQNEKVFPPQKEGDERRPAYVCHVRTNIRGNFKNMWYQACFIRGMSVDEALKQLSFNVKGFTGTMKEILLEAQEKGVREHGIEFKSNMWVAESFISKGQHFKGMRRHARMRMGEVRYQFNHYYIKLEEGKPPKHFYTPQLTGEEMLNKWMEQMRGRHIGFSI